MNFKLTLAPKTAARIVEILDATGIPTPDRLAVALEVHRKLNAAPADVAPLDAMLRDATADNALEIVDEWLTTAVAAEGRKQHAAEINQAAQRGLLRAMTATSDELLEAARPRFTEAAERFTTCLRNLPKGWDNPDALLRAGGEAVDRHEAARAASHQLDLLAELRAELPQTRIEGFVATALEFAEVPNAVDATILGQALNQPPATTLGRWATILGHDQRIKLVWRNPAEHKAAVKNYTPHETATERVHLGGGINGLRLSRIEQTPTPTQ